MASKEQGATHGSESGLVNRATCQYFTDVLNIPDISLLSDTDIERDLIER